MKPEIFTTKKDIPPITIALLSDIHYYPEFNKKILNKLYNQIKKEKPNYTCIVGDILDDAIYTELDPLIDWFNKISTISPIIWVKGNHDTKTAGKKCWLPQNNFILETVLESNPQIHYLNNNIYSENNISFYGINPSYKYYEKDYENYNSFKKEIDESIQLNKNNYNICLIHSPINIYNYIQNEKTSLNQLDLILSGHMHNGCLPSWITNIINKVFKSNKSIISPKQTLFPDFSHGRVYKIKDGYIYGGVTKLSKSTKFLHYFDFLYCKKIKIIKIKRD